MIPYSCSVGYLMGINTLQCNKGTDCTKAYTLDVNIKASTGRSISLCFSL